MDAPRLLGLSGSLRQESSNSAILRTLVEALAGKAELTIHGLGALPLYNQDLDTETPPDAVRDLRAAIAEADGLIIASPEYNYGVPGVLKNALDWASRPNGRSCLFGKPVLTLTASPAATGGVRAQAQLNETLRATTSRLTPGPQIAVAGVTAKLQRGHLVDAATLNFMLARIDDLLRDAHG